MARDAAHLPIDAVVSIVVDESSEAILIISGSSNAQLMSSCNVQKGSATCYHEIADDESIEFTSVRSRCQELCIHT